MLRVAGMPTCWEARADFLKVLQTARDEAVHAFLAASLDGKPPAVCQMTFKH